MSVIEQNILGQLRQYRRAIDDAMTRDRGRLLGLWSRWQSQPHDHEARANFQRVLSASRAQRQVRENNQPVVTVDTRLPIAQEAERIVALIRAHPVVIIAGETGSGRPRNYRSCVCPLDVALPVRSGVRSHGVLQRVRWQRGWLRSCKRPWEWWWAFRCVLPRRSVMPQGSSS